MMEEYKRKTAVFWESVPADQLDKYKMGLKKYQQKRRHYLSVKRQQREGTYVSSLAHPGLVL